MIDSIELKDWKTHGETSLSFAKGTNILLGQMGAGKSSIMDAISFALFGTFPSINHRRSNMSNIIRNRPEQRQRASVRLAFTVNGKKYEVYREVSTSGIAKATLAEDDKYIQSQPQRVNEQIEKLLKVDYDLFSKAVYSEQNRLDYFLELPAASRKKQIDELLGLDKFANAQENVTGVINRIKDATEENEKTAAGFDLKGLKEQLSALQKESEKISKEHAKIQEEIEKFTKKKKETETELKELKEEYASKVRLEKEIGEHESKMEILLSEISKIDSKKLGQREALEKKIKGIKEKIDGLRGDSKNAETLLREAQEAFAHANADVSRYAKEAEEKKKLLDEQKKSDKKNIESEISECARNIDQSAKDAADCSAQIKESAKWISELKKHVQKCPVCERELTGDIVNKLLENKNKQLETFGKGLREAESKTALGKKRHEKLSAELNRIIIVEERLKAYSNSDSKLDDAQSKAKSLKEKVESARKTRENLGELLIKANEEYNALSSDSEMLKRREGYATEMEKAKEIIVKKSASLKEIKVDDKRLEALQSEHTELSSNISKFNADLMANTRYQKDKEAQMTDKESEINKVNLLYEEIKAKRDVIDNLAKFKVSLQETQTQLRNQLVGSVNEIMHDVWPEIYPYGDYRSITLEPTADDYILRVKIDDKDWAEVNAVASGGERSIACLAMRIAFALVLAPNLKWLILDEPTHNIDQQGLQKFVKMFSETMPRIIDQVFIITHDEVLRQTYNSKVYVFTRDKDENKATVVQEL